jgi:hypothetical protein
LTNHKTKSVTISLPLTLISDINAKRGCLATSLAYKILLQNALAIIDGPLIQNMPEMQNHE